MKGKKQDTKRLGAKFYHAKSWGLWTVIKKTFFSIFNHFYGGCIDDESIIAPIVARPYFKSTSPLR